MQSMLIFINLLVYVAWLLINLFSTLIFFKIVIWVQLNFLFMNVAIFSLKCYLILKNILRLLTHYNIIFFIKKKKDLYMYFLHKIYNRTTHAWLRILEWGLMPDTICKKKHFGLAESSDDVLWFNHSV